MYCCSQFYSYPFELAMARLNSHVRLERIRKFNRYWCNFGSVVCKCGLSLLKLVAARMEIAYSPNSRTHINYLTSM